MTRKQPEGLLQLPERAVQYLAHMRMHDQRTVVLVQWAQLVARSHHAALNADKPLHSR
jgi:hypothetical protein